MATQTPLGARLERARVDAGFTALEARHALALSETAVLARRESGETIPSVAQLEHVVEVYTSTEHYIDNARPYPGRAKSDGRFVPPDVLLGELLEAREHALEARRRERLKRFMLGLGSVVAALSLGGPTAANATNARCHGSCLLSAREPRTKYAVRTAHRTHRRAKP